MVDFLKILLDKIDIKTLLILILIVVIILLRSCSGDNDKSEGQTIKIDGKEYNVLKNEKDTVYKEITKTEYKPGDVIYRDKVIYVPVPVDVDTNEILKEYYSKIIYKDTLLLDDSLGYITVIDTITNNKILGRLWDSKVNKIIITDITYVEEPKKVQVFAGGVIGADNVNVINFIGPSVVVKNKKDQLYSFGVGFSNAKAISIQGGMYWKIKLKKDKK